MLIEYVTEDGGLTRVSWEVKICGNEGNSTINDLLCFHPTDRFKVVCFYKLISGNLKTGPCVLKAWLTLTDKSPRKEEVDQDYCHQPFSLWGNVYDFTSLNQGSKHLLIKSKISSTTEEWKSDMFHIEYPARLSKGWKFGYHSTGWNDYTNTLYLNCVLWIQSEISVSQSEVNVAKQLTNLLVRQTNCDVQFYFENNQQIGGHMAILSARSPVFAEMFQHNMKEIQIDIRDVQFEVFKQLIHFIYSGRLPTPLREENAQPLYVAADKYDIIDLKKKCVNFLLSCLRVDNSILLLAWAHLHSIERIKEQAMDYVALHGKEICLQDDWANLIKNYPDLCLIATQRMMANMCLISLVPKI